MTSTVERIFQLMKGCGMSQKKMAELLNTSPSVLSDWKSIKRNLNPSFDQIKAIAIYFNVTTDYLLGIDKPTAPEGELGREVVARAMTEIEGLSDDQVREVIRYAAYIKTRQNE